MKPDASRGFASPYERLNFSPQAVGVGGPAFFTPTQDWWRDQTRQITNPTPGRRGLYRSADPAGPACPMFRRTTDTDTGDTEVSLMGADSEGWLDMGGPAIRNPDPVRNLL